VQSTRRISLAATFLIALAPMSVAMGQSSVAVSPFVSYVPSANQNPLAGFALTFGGTTGLALRGGAEMSIENPSRTNDATGVNSPGGFRPWSADADGMLFLGGLGGGATVFSRALAPYVFSGMGMTGGDSAGVNVTNHGWSYGAGATIPLGLDADLFAEARWRMSQYVLPTAKDAPDSKSELRFGLSFHVGGGSRQPEERPRRRRQRMDDEYDDAPAPVVVVPAPAPTIVVQAPAPAPAPAPTVIVMPAQEPRPDPGPTINVNLPGSIVGSSRRSRRSRHDEVVVVARPVYTAKRDGVVYRTRESTAKASTTSCTRSTTRRRSDRSSPVVVCTTKPR
jgi:hypothetical protein